MLFQQLFDFFLRELTSSLKKQQIKKRLVVLLPVVAVRFIYYFTKQFSQSPRNQPRSAKRSCAHRPAHAGPIYGPTRWLLLEV
jgi:hypothetical protein